MLDLLQQGLDSATEEAALSAALQAQDTSLQGAGLDRLVASLAPFLRAMPAALTDAFAMAEHPEAAAQGLDRAIGFATGQVLHYLFDDRDLLPERDFGVVGLLDDAYLVHCYLRDLACSYPHLLPEPSAYEAPDAETMALVRSLLPAGTADALEHSAEHMIDLSRSLFAVGGRVAGAAEAPAPVLRLAEVLQALEHPQDV